MEIFNQFGFDPKLFVAQIINFLILAFIFKRFLYKPLLKMLKERNERIDQGLTNAEKAEKALESAEKEREEIIKKASLEAEKILDQTEKNAESMRLEMLTTTKTEAEKIITEAKKAAQVEFEKLEKEARNMSLSISEKMLRQILKDMFTKEEQEKIIQRNMKEIQDEKK